jgi:beta-xylosidase
MVACEAGVKALLALRAVECSSGETSMHARRYINPIHAEYFADPYVWRCGQDYFAIGTGRTEADGLAGRTSVFPLLHSPDLVHWRAAGRALMRPARELGDTFWAPEVVGTEGAWFLYYSVGHADRMHQLRVAKSEHPCGPFRDQGGLTDLRSCQFAIDPHPFRDDDGRWYLFHARDFLDERDATGNVVRAGTALVVHELHRMTELSAIGCTVARARCDWQRFAAERPMYGRSFDWHTLEGPCVVKHAGKYYCLYSGGCWQNDTYGVDYVVADSVLGPYSDEGAEGGPRVLRSVPGRVLGPGHCSVTTTDLPADASAKEARHVLVYHAWDAELAARRMCIDRLSFGPSGPSSPGPTWTEQSLT